ncbi:MAG: CHASE2 domain-containing protein [Leptospiraceae bacterium]|nr:CHASE2 domain-containing protein [Leptospiraceae bacterium]
MLPTKKITGFSIWLLPILIAGLLQIFGSLDNLEKTLIDFRYKNFNPGLKFSDKVIIVSINNDSLMHYAQHPNFGRWPWKRKVYLPVLRYIAKQKPKIIFFDILFTEPSKDDSSLVEFNKEFPHVSHTIFLQKEKLSQKQHQISPEILKHSFPVKEIENCDIEFQKLIPPTRQIGKTAPLLHALGDLEFGDRLNKEDLLVYKHNGKFFLSLPLTAFHVTQPIQEISLLKTTLTLQTKKQTLVIPLKDCYYNYHFYSEDELQNIRVTPFSYFSHLFFKNEKPNPQIQNIFKDKIILIGATATSIFDQKITPFGNLPSVLLNATAVSNLLENHFPVRIPTWISFTLNIFLSSLGLFLMFFSKGIIKRTLLPFLILLVYFLFVLGLFKLSIHFNISFFLVSYPISFVISLAYISFLEGRENIYLMKETMKLNKELIYFNENLEKKIKERTKELEEEKEYSDKILEELKIRNEVIEQEQKKSESLLHNILPPKVAKELKEKGEVKPIYYESISVLFTDLKGFTKVAEAVTVEELVKELDACFFYFDDVITKYNLEKIKTIGDSYMCAGGLPEKNFTHAIDACLAAIEIQNTMNQAKELKILMGLPFWELRLGIHIGPVIAGVVGKHKFAYDIWGDTVNTASRMESSGETGKINISGAVYDKIKIFFECQYRGKIQAKNKGEIDMYFLNRLKNKFSRDEDGKVPNDYFHDIYEKIKKGWKIYKK